MQASEVAKQALHLSRVTFDNTVSAMLLLQEQAERTIDIYLDQVAVFPQAGKMVVDTWMKACRTNREEFKKVAEKNYEMFASMFNDAEKSGSN